MNLLKYGLHLAFVRFPQQNRQELLEQYFVQSIACETTLATFYEETNNFVTLVQSLLNDTNFYSF